MRNLAIAGILLAAPISAGTLAIAPSANAAIVGQTNFSGGVTVPGGISTATLSSNSLTFTPDPTPVSLAAQEGFFASFNSATIVDIISFTPFETENPFLDFGNLTIPGVVGFGGEDSVTDGINTFTLTGAEVGFSQSGSNVAIEVALSGFFTDALGKTAAGAGNITLQANNKTVSELEAFLDAGNSLEASFSGGTFTAATPEPLTVIGSGLALGLGAALKRRRDR